MDGSIQQGFFIIKNDQFRYEYFNKNLYIIFKDKTNFYLVDKQKKSKPKIINSNTEVLEQLVNLAQSYPSLSNSYSTNDFDISLEKSDEHGFYKRIKILSNKLNLNIYLNDCNFKPINNIFFKMDPVFEYIIR